MLWKNTIILLACILGASATCQNIPRSITIKGITKTLKLAGQGQTGCAFQVVGGWPWVVDDKNVDVPAIAKVLIPPSHRPNLSFGEPEKEGLLSEVDALTLAKQLYAYDPDNGGREWLIIQEFPSNIWKRVDKTQAWGDFFGPNQLFLTPARQKTLAQCGDFMDKIAEGASAALKAFVYNNGLFQNDFHYGNILANDQLSEFRIIDFGSMSIMTGDEFDDGEEELQAYWYLRDGSQLPVEDTTTRAPGKNYQGVCDSVMRAKDVPRYAPFPPDTIVEIKKRSSRLWGRKN